MTSVIVDPKCTDDERRHALYCGDIFVHTHSPAIEAFVAFTRAMIEDAFDGRDPETAQFEMDVHEYAHVLGDLKPAFIHHPESKTHLRAILEEHGADPELTYFDVPRMRTSTSDNYLTTGIAYAFHPHRDTWYSAPMMQLNWWLPIYDVSPDNVVAFHPQYFDRGIANGSERYNYYAWNRDSRAIAASQIGVDTRDQPKPEEPIDLDPQIRPVPPVGGVMVFSAPSCTPRSPTRRAARASASTSAWSTGPMWRPAAEPSTWTRTARAPRCATTCASVTSSDCRRRGRAVRRRRPPRAARVRHLHELTQGQGPAQPSTFERQPRFDGWRFGVGRT